MTLGIAQTSESFKIDMIAMSNFRTRTFRKHLTNGSTVNQQGRGRGNAVPYFTMATFSICNRCGLVPAAHRCARRSNPNPTPTRPDIDATGRRLEAVARLIETLTRPDPTWSGNYWRRVKDELSRQWQHETACHDIPSVRH